MNVSVLFLLSFACVFSLLTSLPENYNQLSVVRIIFSNWNNSLKNNCNIDSRSSLLFNSIWWSHNKNAYAGPHTAVAPSGHRRNLRFLRNLRRNLREKNLFFTWPYRGHRRNPFFERRNPFFERRFSSTNKIDRTNTAVFGIIIIYLWGTTKLPNTVEIWGRNQEWGRAASKNN